MTRQREGVEKGFNIFLENSDTFVSWLVGTAAPIGTGEQAAAPIGSMYQRIGVGETYQKKTNVGSPVDWVLFNTGSTVTRWRGEQIDVTTNDAVVVGTRDIIANPFSDDDDGLVPADFTIGNFIIQDADGTPTMLEITNVAGDDITFAAASALVAGDSFITDKYLPDASGGENKAMIVFSDGVIVKLSDIDWNFATGINLSGGFTKNNGTVTGADSVESAIEKLADNQEDLTTLTGVAQGSTSNGAFSGSTLTDTNIKGNLQELETAHEEVDQNVNDLITLSGVAENATNQGAMNQGDILTDNQTNNSLFKQVDTELTRQRGKGEAAGVTAVATIDSVLVDSVIAVEWIVTIMNNASKQNRRHFKVFAGHDGIEGGADAANVDDTVGKILKQGANFDWSVSVDLNGVGAAQVMRLRVASTEGAGVDIQVKRIENLF